MDIFDYMGITVDDDLSSFEKEKKLYKKIDALSLDIVDQMLKLIPTIIDAKYYNSDVYRVIYNKGLGVLQKSAKYPGMFLANVVEEGTNNKIKDAARLQALSNAPQVLGGVFNAMSIVTGQYYMSRIDTRLKNLEKNVEAVQEFLDDSRRSELYGNLEFLKETQARMPFYIEDNILAASTLTSVQTIKINSLGNLAFYKEQIERIKSSLSNDDKLEVIVKNINDMYRFISEYWFALQLYCFSSYLEPQISQNVSPQVIHRIAEDIQTKCKLYKNQYDLWKDALEKYIETAKAFEDNQVFNLLKKMKVMPASGGVVIAQSVIKLFGTIASKIDSKMKEKNHKIVKDEIMKKAPNTDVESVMKMREELLLLEQIYSDRLEFVKVGEEIYYRIDDAYQRDESSKKKKSDKTNKKPLEV